MGNGQCLLGFITDGEELLLRLINIYENRETRFIAVFTIISPL